MRIRDRPEFATKPKPLTLPKEASVAEAVARMAEHDYGCVIIVEPDGRIVGILTERDIVKRLVNQRRDAAATAIAEIMTSNPRIGRDTDRIVDWLRIMSNERFRRLPVVDAEGRLVSIMTQGDFVSYTWPDLIYRLRDEGGERPDGWQIALIAGGIMAYTLIMILLLRSL